MAQADDLNARRQALKSGTVKQKLAAIQELSKSSKLEDLDLILPLLTGPEESLRQPAAKAYLAFPDNLDRKGRMQVEDLSTWNALFASSHWPLLKLRDYLLPVLLAERDPNPAARQALIRELTKISDPAEEQWDLEIDETHPGECGNYDHSREDALARLVPREWRYSVQLLRLSGSYRASDLIAPLKPLKQRAIREAFLMLLRNPDAWIRAQAALALENEPDAVALLTPSARDSHAIVRQYVGYALEEHRTPEALRLLLDLAFDPVKGVRSTAHRALEQRKDPYIEWFAIQELRSRLPAISAYGAELIYVLETSLGRIELERAALQKGHPARALCVELVTYRFTFKTDTIIASALLDLNPDVLISACRGIRNLERHGFVKDLERLSALKNKEVAEAAIDALESFKRGN